jgi:NitT/TauT family transport system permease protein
VSNLALLDASRDPAGAMTKPVLPGLAHIWGRSHEERPGGGRSSLVDLAIAVGLAGLLFGLSKVSVEWTGTLRPQVDIDLSPLALPRYAFFSLSRGLMAYVLSLGFTLVYGYWAAKDHVAERILVPLLDVLQSIPVLGFMPGLVLALVAAFPSSNVGLELAAVLMIFTGQAWNMTFSFYHSLRAVPREQIEVATLYRFGWWRVLREVELPFATTGLVWNSMMSMAGGWFFLMISEAFVLGDKDFRLPGLGSYMSVAVARRDRPAMLWAVAAMVLMIVVLDQLLWRPLVVWAQKFRVEEGGGQEAMSSWFYDFLRRSHVLPAIGRFARRTRRSAPHAARPAAPARSAAASALASRLLFVALVLILGFGGYKLVLLFRAVPPGEWLHLFGLGGRTLGRVVVSTLLGTLWALPAGIAVGLSPRLSRVVQPVAQVAASFPAPMLFPAVIVMLDALHVELTWGSIVLMLLGTQWYIFFNVIAGAVGIPADLREAAVSYHFTLRQKLQAVYLPSVFPYLVTGWVTAAGGAWNASIVSEYVTSDGKPHRALGLGSEISSAAASADLSLLAAAVAVMSVIVVVFNRTVWHACYRLAERRYSLDK